MKSLQQQKGNFEAKITVLLSSKKELTWKNNIMTATKILKKVSVDATLYTNANLEGWKQVETGLYEIKIAVITCKLSRKFRS